MLIPKLGVRKSSYQVDNAFENDVFTKMKRLFEGTIKGMQIVF